MSSIRLSRRKVLSAAALFGSLDAVGFNVLPASASPSPIGVHDASKSAQSAVPQPVFFKRGHKLETGFQAEIRSPLLGEIRALRIRMPDRQKAALNLWTTHPLSSGLPLFLIPELRAVSGNLRQPQATRGQVLRV